MSEIGATLREARVRAGVDIAEIEAATKIRAKYLRALENDDWDVLPGPAYVRTFLRAYAEIVGIDPTPLLEEIRLAEAGVNADSERPLQRRPAAPRRQRSADDERRRAGRARVSGRGGGPDRRAITRAAILVVVALLLVLAIIGLASSGDDDGARTDTAAGDTSSVLRAQTTTGTRTTTTSPSTEVERVSLQVQPLAGRPVQVCLVDATGVRRIDGATLQPGGTQPVYRSRRFKIAVGPGGARLVIGGRSRSVPSAGAGYLVTAEGRTRLNRTDWPSCGT